MHTNKHKTAAEIKLLGLNAKLRKETRAWKLRALKIEVAALNCIAGMNPQLHSPLHILEGYKQMVANYSYSELLSYCDHLQSDMREHDAKLERDMDSVFGSDSEEGDASGSVRSELSELTDPLATPSDRGFARSVRGAAKTTA